MIRRVSSCPDKNTTGHSIQNIRIYLSRMVQESTNNDWDNDNRRRAERATVKGCHLRNTPTRDTIYLPMYDSFTLTRDNTYDSKWGNVKCRMSKAPVGTR